MRLSALFFIALLLAATPAAANDRLSAAELMQMCSSTHDVDYGYCAGYITAIADQMLSTARRAASAPATMRASAASNMSMCSVRLRKSYRSG